MSPAPAAPSDRQFRFLRNLAQQTGTSFVYPKTSRQASAEIERLLASKDKGEGAPVELDDEHEVDVAPVEGSDDRDGDLAYATAIEPGEVAGFGSSASWRSSATPAVVLEPPRVGERTELERYRVSGGERVLYGQRINGSVRITDRPAEGLGRSYLVERQLERDGYDALNALLADYIEQARRLDDVPMASSVIRRDLELTGLGA